MEYRVSHKTACDDCQDKHKKCTHNARVGGAGAGAAAGKPKPAAPAARMSYAEAVCAAQRAPAAAPRALTAPEREAAEAFMAPEYEVLYLDAKDVPGYNPDLR